MTKYFVIKEDKSGSVRERIRLASFKISFSGIDEDGNPYCLVSNAPDNMNREQFSMETGIPINRIRVFSKINMRFLR